MTERVQEPSNTTNGHSKHVPAEVPAPVASGILSLEQAREEVAYMLGLEAYLWGLPLYAYCTSLTAQLKSGAIGLNTLRAYDRLAARDPFGTPNDLTVESFAAFDASREPVVVHVPRLDRERWYLVQIGDAFDEVITNIGGTKGPAPGAYVITGPEHGGRVPSEMTHVTSRTKMGIVTVKLFVDGHGDVPAVLDAQRGFHVMPLSAYLREGLAYRPLKQGPLRQPALHGPVDLLFFELLGHALQSYLPLSATATDALVGAFRAIGLSPAAGFDWRELDPTTLRGLARAGAAGGQIADHAWEALGEVTNGWRYKMTGGRSGHDLAVRAALAKHVLGAQLATEVLEPRARVDLADEALTGEHKYVLDLPAPPVSAFWSLALLDEDMRFVENAIGRYSIGSTTPGLALAADGSLRIQIQHERPDDAANWLPAPQGNFNLTMRLYGPEPPILDGSYRLPAIRRAL